MILLAVNSPRDPQEQLVTMIGIGCVLAIALFMLIREMCCWYWKVNRTVALLGQIAAHTNEASEEIRLLKLEVAEARRMPPPASPARGPCPGESVTVHQYDPAAVPPQAPPRRRLSLRLKAQKNNGVYQREELKPRENTP